MLDASKIFARDQRGHPRKTSLLICKTTSKQKQATNNAATLKGCLLAYLCTKLAAYVPHSKPSSESVS